MAHHDIRLGKLTGTPKQTTRLIEDAGLTWLVVESLPLYNDITTRSGYSYFGRMKGLAELRGVIHALAAIRR